MARTVALLYGDADDAQNTEPREKARKRIHPCQAASSLTVTDMQAVLRHKLFMLLTGY
jgi:hypothetical protein